MSDSPDDRDRGVDVEGPADGPTIVLVHGSAFTRAMWAPQRRALTARFRVVAPDMPGHGSRADESFRLEPAVQVVDDAVSAHADDDALLVGISLGGYVATEYARRNPERIGGLVIAGSSANPTGGLELVTRALGGLVRLLTRSERIERGIEGLAARWVRGLDLAPEDEREILDAGFYPRAYGEAGPELAGRDFRSAFAAYPGPALVLNGETDRLFRRGAEGYAEAARDARVEVVHGAGHVSNLEQPTRFTAAIRGFHSAVAEPPRAQ